MVVRQDAPADPSLGQDYLAVIRSRKWLIAAVTLLILAGALAYSLSRIPIYESAAAVLVRPLALTTAEITDSLPPNMDTQERIAETLTIADLVLDDEGEELLDGVDLQGLTPAQALLEQVDVSVETNTEILSFRYQHQDPELAAAGAQAFADAYLEYRREQALDELLAVSESLQSRIAELNTELTTLETELAETDSASKRETISHRTNLLTAQVLVLQQQVADLALPQTLRVGDLVEPAEPPEEPSSPNHLLNAVFALVVGVGSGVGIAFYRERVEDVLTGRGDLAAQARAPVLSTVPRVAGWRKGLPRKLVTVEEGEAPAAEAYRTLRTGVLFLATQRQLKTIVVTSAREAEGKTTLVANLGAALAQAGKKVTVIGADLRRPQLGDFFGTDPRAGLVDVLSGDALDGAVQETSIPGLSVLASGKPARNPAELLGSETMVRVIEKLSQSNDFVLIDTAPVLAVADALILSSLADGVIFLAAAQSTPRSAIRHAREQLDQVHAPVVGAVLNGLDAARTNYYSSGYYSSEEEKVPFWQRLLRRDTEADEN